MALTTGPSIYVAVAQAGVRSTADKDEPGSIKLGQLGPGEEVQVLESRTINTNRGTQLRLRTEKGWLSLHSANGLPLIRWARGAVQLHDVEGTQRSGLGGLSGPEPESEVVMERHTPAHTTLLRIHDRLTAA